MKTKNSVLQEWVEDLSWKEQTVLLCGLRGVDTNGSPELKLLTRWIRSVVLKNAAPHKTFMRETNFKNVQEIADNTPLVFDMVPTHFFGHLLHTMEVIGYRHPDPEIAQKAITAYHQLCEFLHVNMETKEQMTKRLQDEVVKEENLN